MTLEHGNTHTAMVTHTHQGLFVHFQTPFLREQFNVTEKKIGYDGTDTSFII